MPRPYIQASPGTMRRYRIAERLIVALGIVGAAIFLLCAPTPDLEGSHPMYIDRATPSTCPNGYEGPEVIADGVYRCFLTLDEGKP